VGRFTLSFILSRAVKRLITYKFEITHSHYISERVLRAIVNVLIDDQRFNANEIEQALDSVKDFFKQCGHDIVFVWRLGLYQPIRGHVLHFAIPNGSQAKGRIAKVTYNDWIIYSHLRPHIIIHELNHSIFGCPDHYEGSPFYEPCTGQCIMHSLEEGVLCSNCLARVQDGKLSLLPAVATIVAFTAPLWFPILVDWLGGNRRH